MELREKLRTEPESLKTVLPLPLADFKLFSQEIPSIGRSISQAPPSPEPVPVPAPQLDLQAPDEDDIVQQAARMEVHEEPRQAGDTDPAPSAVDAEATRRLRMAWLAAVLIVLIGLVWLLS
jgi:hypothetical protein